MSNSVICTKYHVLWFLECSELWSLKPPSMTIISVGFVSSFVWESTNIQVYWYDGHNHWLISHSPKVAYRLCIEFSALYAGTLAAVAGTHTVVLLTPALMLVPCIAEPWLLLSCSMFTRVIIISKELGGGGGGSCTGITHACWTFANGNLECYFRNHGTWSSACVTEFMLL
jgi:hypothetical protein